MRGPLQPKRVPFHAVMPFALRKQICSPLHLATTQSAGCWHEYHNCSLVHTASSHSFIPTSNGQILAVNLTCKIARKQDQQQLLNILLVDMLAKVFNAKCHVSLLRSTAQHARFAGYCKNPFSSPAPPTLKGPPPQPQPQPPLPPKKLQ